MPPTNITMKQNSSVFSFTLRSNEITDSLVYMFKILRRSDETMILSEEVQPQQDIEVSMPLHCIKEKVLLRSKSSSLKVPKPMFGLPSKLS